MKERIMLLDVEAIDLEKPFIYDIGYIVAEKKELEYQEIFSGSFIIKQVYDNKMLFETAYYAKKKPQYTNDMKGKKSIKKYYGHVMRHLAKIIKDNNIKMVLAYNATFDNRAFNFTSSFLKTSNPLKNIRWVDIMPVANKYIHLTNDYKAFALKNKLTTKKGYLQTNAQATYQYLTQNTNFKEKHMGLDDCKIELDILNYGLRKGYKFQALRKRFIKAN